PFACYKPASRSSPKKLRQRLHRREPATSPTADRIKRRRSYRKSCASPNLQRRAQRSCQLLTQASADVSARDLACGSCNRFHGSPSGILQVFAAIIVAHIAASPRGTTLDV